MDSSPFAFRLYQTLLQKRHANRGFTLTELLISIVMAGIIITGLLFLVVEMLRADQTEAVLNQTQQDINNAMEYITRDLQEAVFVYPSQTDMEAITSQLTDLPSGGGTPVLAFWRVDPVDPLELSALRTSSSNCEVGTTEFKDECDVVSLRQSVYTLVVYILQSNTANSIWEGNSRIIKYELPQYTSLATLTEREGYKDPAPNNFEDWTRDGSETDGKYAVLVDSIDNPALEIGSGLPQCSTKYQRLPDNSTAAKTSYSFYTCVRDPALTEEEEEALEVPLEEGETARNNQDLIVYLRGDATENRAGLFTTYNESSRLPTLESRILVRGILDKRPF